MCMMLCWMVWRSLNSVVVVDRTDDVLVAPLKGVVQVDAYMKWMNSDQQVECD